MDLDGRIGDLYRLPLAEFTSARNALATRLEKDGDREASERIRDLGKPVFTAWVVNRLYRDDREGFDRLLEAGAKLRRLQTGGAGDPAILRDVMESKRESLRALLGRVETLAAECGVSASRAALRRIEANLDAVASYGDAGPEQQLGRMTGDLEPPGFEALLATGAVAARHPHRTAKQAVTRSDSRKLERARTTRDRARKEVERRQVETERAERFVQKAEERQEETREMVRAAERGLRLIRDKNRRAERDLADTRTRLDSAQKTLSRARESLHKAQAALKTASKKVLPSP